MDTRAPFLFIGGSMSSLSINDLLLQISEYNSNKEEIKLIKKAYSYAEELHKGQKRQSGEDYISHPLNVAYILAEMHADRDTICAALLHDTLEDTKITKDDIKINFNEDIANLVEGVTKLSRMNFSSKQAQNMANTRKIITSIKNDVRIIIIKLADRLHNMRTLQYKSEFKQKENAMETLDIFVPLAYYIGAYHLKSELEDLSLQYLYPEKYKRIQEVKLKIEEDSRSCLTEMLQTINKLLSDNNIPHKIKVRIKNIYGIYKQMQQGNKLSHIHDLLSLKVMVDSISNCYQTLGLIHSKYHPINNKFKDYIYNPKTNMYRSLHTTVFGKQDRLTQIQIRTFDMDKIASFGLTIYWDINKGNARHIMQDELKNKFQFYKSLVEIDSMFADNQEFVNQIKKELLMDNVYVYTTKGEIIELPKGSTPIDFAYKIHSSIGNCMISAKVNDKTVDEGYILQNKDRVRIITDTSSYGPKKEWLDKVKTAEAKRKIKEFTKKENS